MENEPRYIRNHKFNIEKPDDFYKEEVNDQMTKLYQKPDEFWEENRFENLNKDEVGVYKMLDTLKTDKKFKRFTIWLQFWEVVISRMGNFDYGPIFSTFGYNEVEGLRIRDRWTNLFRSQ